MNEFHPDLVKGKDRLTQSIPARLARVGLVAVFAAVCIPGFAFAFGQAPSSGTLSAGLFLLGLVLLAASVFTAIVEGLVGERQPWLPVFALSASALIPFFNSDAAFPSDNRNWLITHLTLIGVLLSVSFFSRDFIAALLRGGMIASLATLLAGAGALSVDERSLFVLDGRLRGVFGHANMTGLLAVAALFLALSSTGRWKRLDLLLSVCVIAAATSLTSLAAAGLGLATWLARERALRIVVLTIGLCSLFIPALIVKVLGSNLDPTLFTGRTAAWQWALSLEVPPLSGIGLGLFETLGAGQFVPWFHTHNQVIMDYITGGWPLVSTTVLLLAAAGLRAVQASEQGPLVMWSVLILQCATEVPLLFNFPSGSMLSSAIILILIVQGATASSVHPVARVRSGSAILLTEKIRRA